MVQGINTERSKMEKTHTKSALKFVKNTTSSWNPNSAKGMPKDKLKATPKPAAKENTKPVDFKLHTEQRAVKRAMFNYSVATNRYLMEIQKKQIEKLQKMIEEEEVRLLRKEMVPKAQLMPFFDRPFYPQRSNRPLTIPREPSFRSVNSKCWSCVSENDLYYFQQHAHAWSPIK